MSSNSTLRFSSALYVLMLLTWLFAPLFAPQLADTLEKGHLLLYLLQMSPLVSVAILYSLLRDGDWKQLLLINGAGMAFVFITGEINFTYILAYGFCFSSFVWSAIHLINPNFSLRSL